LFESNPTYFFSNKAVLHARYHYSTKLSLHFISRSFVAEKLSRKTFREILLSEKSIIVHVVRWSVRRLFYSVNIYLRRLFQYPLSTL